MKRRKGAPKPGSATIGKYRRELRFCVLKSKQLVSGDQLSDVTIISAGKWMFNAPF